MGSQLELVLIGALGGGLVASTLTSFVNWLIHRSNLSSRRKQWVLDKKTAEYRELLSTLTQSVECMAQNSTDFGLALPSLLTEERQRFAYDEAVGEARRTIQDRIFISKPMQDADILSLWKLLAGERDMTKFWNLWERLHETILRAARQELHIKGELPEQR